MVAAEPVGQLKTPCTNFPTEDDGGDRRPSSITKFASKRGSRQGLFDNYDTHSVEHRDAGVRSRNCKRLKARLDRGRVEVLESARRFSCHDLTSSWEEKTERHRTIMASVPKESGVTRGILGEVGGIENPARGGLRKKR
jgi:hypothetical protein